MVRNVTKTTKRELSWLEDGQAAAGALVDGEMRSGKVVTRVRLCKSEEWETWSFNFNLVFALSIFHVKPHADPMQSTG